MKKKREPLDILRLHDKNYLLKWSYILANRYPEDPQLSIVLGFMAGKISNNADHAIKR